MTINPNYAVTDVHPSPNYDPGRPLGSPTGIVIHWWGLPERGQTHDQVVNYLINGNRVNPTSAHYVASVGRVTQLVSDGDRAWHCAGNNMKTIGIECHPAALDGDMKTIARLIAAIRSEWGNLPLSRHCDHFATACPGNYKDKLETLDYLATHEGEEDMQLSDQVTRPDGHTASVNDVLAYIDLRIERIESVLIGGQDKKGEDGKPTGARTNIFDEAAWNATNFARVYQGIEALSKRVDDLVNLIEVGASK